MAACIGSRTPACPHGRGRWQEHPRGWRWRPYPEREVLPRGLQPRWSTAGRNRVPIRPSASGQMLPKWRPPMCARCGTSSGHSVYLRRGWNAEMFVRTSTCPCAIPRFAARYPYRDEERQARSVASRMPVRFEIQRQAAILAAGGTIVQETRHYHEEDGTTSAGRVKSDSEDYRYFPEHRSGACCTRPCVG